jgi:hypothetical protein
MKVRMIFGTYIDPGDDKPLKDLPVDSEQDLPDAVAKDLIDQGRAEPLMPAKPAK